MHGFDLYVCGMQLLIRHAKASAWIVTAAEALRGIPRRPQIEAVSQVAIVPCRTCLAGMLSPFLHSALGSVLPCQGGDVM